MKKSLKLILCLALVMSTLLCLTACGKNEESLKNNAGTYVVSAVSAQGITYSGSTLDSALVQAGLSGFTLVLNSDGTGTAYAGGQSNAIEWDGDKFWPTNNSGETAALTFSGNTLSYTKDGTTVTMTKQ